MRARPLAVLVTLTLTAGCILAPEESTPGDAREDDAPFGLRWQENFTVPEDATVAFVNVTIERAGDDTTRMEFRVLDPANESVIVEDAQWDAGRNRVTVNAVLGDEAATTGETTSRAALVPGEWSFEVHATGSVRVVGDVVVLTESNGHRET